MSHSNSKSFGSNIRRMLNSNPHFHVPKDNLRQATERRTKRTSRNKERKHFKKSSITDPTTPIGVSLHRYRWCADVSLDLTCRHGYRQRQLDHRYVPCYVCVHYVVVSSGFVRVGNLFCYDSYARRSASVRSQLLVCARMCEREWKSPSFLG